MADTAVRVRAAALVAQDPGVRSGIFRVDVTPL